jgi:hypothetical protein
VQYARTVLNRLRAMRKNEMGHRGANMRKIFVLGLAILTALSVAGCSGKGKIPLGKGKGKTPIHTRG